MRKTQTSSPQYGEGVLYKVMYEDTMASMTRRQGRSSGSTYELVQPHSVAVFPDTCSPDREACNFILGSCCGRDPFASVLKFIERMFLISEVDRSGAPSSRKEQNPLAWQSEIQ